MSLKSMKKSCDDLMTTLDECGVKLTAKNKKMFESFIENYSKTLEEVKRSAFKKGILFAESKIRPVVESILKHQTINQKLASAIQNKAVALNESRKMAAQVDKYLSEVLTEEISKVKAIDYAKLNKYETIVESLKDVLVVNDSSFKEKAEDFSSAYQTQMVKYFKENAELKKELQNKSIVLENSKKETELAKGKALLESKAANLPAFEAKKVKEQLKNLTEAEVEQRFDEACKTAEEEAKSAVDTTDTTLEEDVNALIEAETANSENSNKEDAQAPEDTDDENQEDDGQRLEESVIYSDQVKYWMSLANRITPIG